MLASKKVIGLISETLNSGEFEWRISNCSAKLCELFTLENSKYLNSPTFSFSSCTWFVRMYPNGYLPSDIEWVSLYLRKEKSQSAEYVSSSLEMTFQGIQLAKSDGIDILKKEEIGWAVYEHYIQNKTVLDYLSKETKNCSQLTIKIRLKELVSLDEDKVRTKGKEILCQNYRDLLLCGEDHDLVIKVKGKKLKAHCIIMKSRCPVFKSMLTHEMLEKEKGVVVIPDCDPLAFEQFLFYVYTGELEVLDESTVLGLYFIADKYNMEDLKEECSTFIKKSLSTHVFCDVFKLALKHSDKALLQFVTKYFIDKAKEILVTVEWQTFIKENPVQANELIIKVVDKCSFCGVHSVEDSAKIEKSVCKSKRRRMH